MSLAAGTRLGPYEVLGLIGAGGMGEVYKAKDTRLDRTVAIKVLPTDISNDPNRRARFEREARTIATLSHPHICTLYDVGEHASSLFFVMEHLTGETLADRLRKGALPIDQALDIGAQIADALSAAHRAGIIHRDLKPANVMLTKTGVKLLDFGLAKLKREMVHAGGASATGLPTQTEPLTGEGTILGTLQYMAPEQLEGKETDARTDIWALGLVLYEMLTGKRAFVGQSSASLIAAILEREPAALSMLQPLTPPGIDRLVRQCLAKSPEDRPDTAHDLANELSWMREVTSGVPLGGPGPSNRQPWTALAAGAIVAVAVGATAIWLTGHARSAGPVTRLLVDSYPADSIHSVGIPTSFDVTAGGSRTAFTWTPDGRSLVFVGRRADVQQLYVRALDREEARPLAGTEGAEVPAVAPDGEWVAFWAGHAIKKVRLGGGPVMDIATAIASPPTGLAWDTSGRLYFGASLDRIWSVGADGQPQPVTRLERGERTHVLPSVLPGERGILYTVRQRLWTWGDEEIVAFSPRSGERKVLLRDAADARYVATGHLVFLRRGVLFAVRFDPDRLAVVGEPVPILGNVSQALTSGFEGNLTGAGQFAIAATGTLAWVRGPLQLFPDARLVRLDRRGRVSLLSAPPKQYGYVRASSDGRQLAVSAGTLTENLIWKFDLVRGTITPLAADGETEFPLWTPDGQRIVFNWLNNGRASLAWRSADGIAAPDVLVAENLVPSSWTPDGRQLAVTTLDGGLSVVTIESGRARVQPLANSTRADTHPEFAPNGHWLAFASNVSGRTEVYVRPYPGPGAIVQVSINGGGNPAWSKDGRELFFFGPRIAGKRRMMVAPFNPASVPGNGPPRVLFEFDVTDFGTGCTPTRCYDVSPDGQYFYGVQTPVPPAPPVVTHINLVLNWFEELKAKVPGR